MKPDLPGYLLHTLDPASERAVEEHLEANPAARQELLKMRPLLKAMDTADPEPSKELIFRTLRTIAGLRMNEPQPIAPQEKRAVTASSAKHAIKTLPGLEPWKASDIDTASSSWRRADAIALIAVVMLILIAIPPVLQYVRDRAMQVECKENLRQIYVSMQRYMQDHQGTIPSLSDNHRAGVYASMLKDSGLWGDRMRLGCPPGSPTTPQSLAEVQRHSDDELAYWQKFAGSYAYHLGYTQNENGVMKIKSLRQGDGDLLPILADRPARNGERPDWMTSNSPNHGGRGQNVLFLGGSADFRVSRSLFECADRDIYCNNQNQQAAGLNIKDVVLGLSESRPKPATPIPND